MNCQEHIHKISCLCQGFKKKTDLQQRKLRILRFLFIRKQKTPVCDHFRPDGTWWMIGGYHALEEVASGCDETLGFVLGVRTLAGLHGQHNAHVFLCLKRVASVFKGSSS